MPRSSPISEDEAARALYLDFEGPGNARNGEARMPILAGVLCEGVYSATLLDKRLAAAMRDRDDVAFEGLDDFLESLLCKARNEVRRIAYWTSAERNLFESRGYPPGRCRL